MEYVFTFLNIDGSFFSTYFIELIAMLLAIIFISLVGGKFFSPIHYPKGLSFSTEESVSNNTTIEAAFDLKNKVTVENIQEQLLQKEQLFQQALADKEIEYKKLLEKKDADIAAANLLQEDKSVLSQQIEQLYVCLQQQQSAFAAAKENTDTIAKLQQAINELEDSNKRTTAELLEYRNGHSMASEVKEGGGQPMAMSNNLYVDENGVHVAYHSNKPSIEQEKKDLTDQIAALQQQLQDWQQAVVRVEEGSDLAEAVKMINMLKSEKLLLQATIQSLQDNLGKNFVSSPSSQKLEKELGTSLYVRGLEKEIELLKKQRDSFLYETTKLENQLKINELSLISQVDMNQEESGQVTHPVKRLTDHMLTLKGENKGLIKKVSDINEKLKLAESTIAAMKERENQVAYLQAKINAMEEDKREFQSKSTELEMMYNNFQKKTDYLLSSKETEIHQLTAKNSFLENDKRNLHNRIAALEEELSKTAFNDFKGRSPLAFNL
jgi:chromosome segregation ATPase